MVMALTEEEKRRSEESKAKALARRNKSARTGPVATATEIPSDSTVHDSNSNNSNRVQTQAKQNVNPPCLQSPTSSRQQSMVRSPASTNQSNSRSVKPPLTEKQKEDMEKKKKAAELRLQQKLKQSGQQTIPDLVAKSSDQLNVNQSPKSSSEKQSSSHSSSSVVKTPTKSRGLTEQQKKDLEEKRRAALQLRDSKKSVNPTTPVKIKPSDSRAEPPAPPKMWDLNPEPPDNRTESFEDQLAECLDLERQFAEEIRAGADCSELTDILHRLDQRMMELMRLESSAAPEGRSQLRHLRSEFLCDCASLMMNREVEDSQIPLLNQLYMAGWNGEVCPQLAEAGSARKVVAGQMVLSLSNVRLERPASTVSKGGVGERIFEALFLSPEQRGERSSSWLCSQRTIITQTAVPSQQEIFSHVQGYFSHHCRDLRMVAWLVLQFHSTDSPDSPDREELNLPFPLPWSECTSSEENLKSEDISTFLHYVLFSSQETEAWVEESKKLPPALCEVRVTREQEEWWEVAIKALTGSCLQQEERETLERGLDRLRGEVTEHTDITLTPLVRRIRDSNQQEMAWLGAGVSVGERTYYRAVSLHGETLTLGDSVLIPRNSMKVARVSNLFDGPDGPTVHVVMFVMATDTVLGDTADRSEVFQVTECEDFPLLAVWRKCEVEVRPQPRQADWRLEGGKDRQEARGVERDGLHFWCQLHYHRKKKEKDKNNGKDKLEVWFEYHKGFPECEGSQEERLSYCGCCLVKKEEEERFNPKTREISNTGETVSVKWDGAPLRVGDSVYLKPGTVTLKMKKAVSVCAGAKKKTMKDFATKDNEPTTPFQVATIREFLKFGWGFKIRVLLYYRPEDTHKGEEAAEKAFINQLYWSEEEDTVLLSKVKGRSYVRFVDQKVTEEELDSWSEAGPDRWFFSQSYSAETREFSHPPPSAQRLTDRDFPRYPGVERRLRCLDIFSGCGGLSHGLHQSGVSTTNWAIEKDEQAAEACRLNKPDCTVFCEDCNKILSLAMEGAASDSQGQGIPRPGEVELLCGGPPCQGFSSMNSHKEGEKSQHNNSQVFTYLSFCDFYRPRFFILENVREFSQYEKGSLLKKYLAGLVQMGYQCTFAVLQAGQFGIPQSRRRLIILAAAPGENLPLYPEPTHVFFPKNSPLTIPIDGVTYDSNTRWKTSAPLRTVTNKDAIRDLPRIENGHTELDMSYKEEAISHYQRKMRNGSERVTDHVPKRMNPLNEERIKRIPQGADWRALPDLEVELSDGSKTEKLETGSKKTLIPPGLARNPRIGCYGRPRWEGTSKTVTTNPEPAGRQGEVLHPSQNRTESVRENARIQGFPDTYRFFGSHLDKYRQVGNAVPPPLGKALGLQIRAALSGEKGERNEVIKKIEEEKGEVRENEAEKRKTGMIDEFFKQRKRIRS